ncbi:MAG: type III pantothenate kinase [Bacteroidetes bacterium]|nr:MAG: type III pantothenate kinase [Bacteroidota bacterium]
MLLAVDIGNSDTVFGLHDGHSWRQPCWRHPSQHYLTAGRKLEDEAKAIGLDLKTIGQVVLSSVVPGVTPHLRMMLQRLTGQPPLLVGPDIIGQLDLGIDNPQEIGSDLVANAVAATDRAGGMPAVVVDFGTALTFTSVSGTGRILGVAIAPGLRTAIRALFLGTAQLPTVPLELPETAIGKSTAHALQAGIMLGYVGLVKELLARTREELGGACRVYATGGLSGKLTPLHPLFDEIDPVLTLDGLRVIGERWG